MVNVEFFGRAGPSKIIAGGRGAGSGGRRPCGLDDKGEGSSAALDRTWACELSPELYLARMNLLDSPSPMGASKMSRIGWRMISSGICGTAIGVVDERTGVRLTEAECTSLRDCPRQMLDRTLVRFTVMLDMVKQKL